jgi:small GTP-binding protein
VIGWRPNAGKSTLLNALVGHDRAIVSETPGTTRDEIEAEAEIEGVLFRFVDTAGLRETADEIEAEGVRRATESIEEADVLLYLYDLTVGLDSEEIEFLQDLANEGSDVQPFLIGNKADEAPDLPVAELDGLSALKLSALDARDDARAQHRHGDREENASDGSHTVRTVSVDLTARAIDPDGRVHVSERLLMLHDGPLLEQSLKAIAGGGNPVTEAPAASPGPRSACDPVGAVQATERCLVY